MNSLFVDCAARELHVRTFGVDSSTPRFVELVGDLPKTASGKVQRAVLRKRGVRSAWDRDRAPCEPKPPRQPDLHRWIPA